jgi:hypothetical protein
MVARRFLGIALLAAIADAGPLRAQDIVLRNVPQEIIPIGYLPWQGTSDELRRIESAPVPRSIRVLCKEMGHVMQGDCKQMLLSWHLRFGTARSAQAALAHVEQRLVATYRLGPGLSKRYAEMRPQALREVEAFLASENLTSDTFLQSDRRINATSHPATVEIRALNPKLSLMRELALLYARAADWYRSPVMLERAEHWRDMLGDAPDEPLGKSASDAQKVLARIAFVHEPEFLDLSIAVSHAAIARNEAAVMAAHRASAGRFDPEYRKESGANWAAGEFSYYRFRIGLLAQELGLDVSDYGGEYLGVVDMRDMYSRFPPEPPDYIEYIPLQDHQSGGHLLDAIVAQGESDGRVMPVLCREPGKIDIGERLNSLLNGGRLVSPVFNPAGYRRVGHLYLDLYAAARRCPKEDNPVYNGAPHYSAYARQVEYFIANYGRLALGR